MCLFESFYLILQSMALLLFDKCDNLSCHIPNLSNILYAFLIRYCVWYHCRRIYQTQLPQPIAAGSVCWLFYVNSQFMCKSFCRHFFSHHWRRMSSHNREKTSCYYSEEWKIVLQRKNCQRTARCGWHHQKASRKYQELLLKKSCIFNRYTISPCSHFLACNILQNFLNIENDIFMRCIHLKWCCSAKQVREIPIITKNIFIRMIAGQG